MNTIRVIVFKDGDAWVAQCLEYDIAAQAADLESLRSRLLATVDAEAQAGTEFNGEPFKGIDPAPRHFHEMWERKATTFRDNTPRPGERSYTVELALAA